MKLAPFAARVVYRAGSRRAVLEIGIDPAEPGAVHAENGDVVLDVEVARSASRLVLRPRLAARGEDVRIEEVELLAVPLPGAAERLRFFSNGWQSWSPARSFGASDRAPTPWLGLIREITASPLAGAAPAGLHSDLVTAVLDPLGGGLVAGFLGGARQFGGFSLEQVAEGLRLRARLLFEGVPLRPGEERSGEPLWVAPDGDVATGLEEWAAALGEAMGARTGAPATTGWCSWYEYFTRIDTARLREDLARASELEPALGLELFQIDDGYQAAIGDWTEPHARVPEGVAGLAGEIRGRGLEPGLWLAPFLVRPEARLAREHPEWLARDRRGRPRRGAYNPMWSLRDSAWALDATHPGAADWLARLCETVTREWGFDFLKLDFLYAAALPAVRFDPSRTGAEVLRRGLEVVRASVGERVHLLGCGCPLGPAVGLVDSMRIGADVAPAWSDWRARILGRDHELPAVKNAIRNTVARAFLHGRLWHNDPDCLLARRRSGLASEEVTALASVIAVSGGTVLLSDALAALDAERLALVERVRAIRDEVLPGSVRSLDLLRADFPRTLWARRRGGGWYLAVLNPDDRAAEVVLHAADLDAPADAFTDATVEDVWTGARFSIARDALALGVLPPHSARLLRRDP